MHRFHISTTPWRAEQPLRVGGGKTWNLTQPTSGQLAGPDISSGLSGCPSASPAEGEIGVALPPAVSPRLLMNLEAYFLSKKGIAHIETIPT